MLFVLYFCCELDFKLLGENILLSFVVILVVFDLSDIKTLDGSSYSFI